MSKDDLTLFFEKKNLKKPDNFGECRTSLNILKCCEYNVGLCNLLGTDPDSGIIGDKSDIKRRTKVYGEHFITPPKP